DHAFLVRLDVVGAVFQGDFHDLLFRGARSEDELAAVLEHEHHAAVLAQVAAVLGQRVAHFGYGALAVVGHAVDDQGGAAHAITLVADFLVVDAFFGAGPALDGAQDVVLGHVGRCGLVPGQAQRGIGVGIGPTGTGGHGDFTDDLCPELAALGVLAPFAVL